MYELENGKDQCMTVLKLVLANLGMWVREHWFPSSYFHATWPRLLPFFHLLTARYLGHRWRAGGAAYVSCSPAYARSQDRVPIDRSGPSQVA